MVLPRTKKREKKQKNNKGFDIDGIHKREYTPTFLKMEIMSFSGAFSAMGETLFRFFLYIHPYSKSR